MLGLTYVDSAYYRVVLPIPPQGHTYTYRVSRRISCVGAGTDPSLSSSLPSSK